MAIMSGCEPVEGADGNNTSSEMSFATKLLGSWERKCIPYRNTDRYITTQFDYKRNGHGVYYEKYYDTSECIELDLEESFYTYITYKLGDVTTASDDTEAYEMDQFFPEMDIEWYDMIRLDEKGKLQYAYEKKGKDGSTPEKRSDYFYSDDKGYTLLEKYKDTDVKLPNVFGNGVIKIWRNIDIESDIAKNIMAGGNMYEVSVSVKGAVHCIDYQYTSKNETSYSALGALEEWHYAKGHDICAEYVPISSSPIRGDFSIVQAIE